MAVWEGKKYKLDKSEHFEEYMKELGKLRCGVKTMIDRAPGNYRFGDNGFVATRIQKKNILPHDAAREVCRCGGAVAVGAGWRDPITPLFACAKNVHCTLYTPRHADIYL